MKIPWAAVVLALTVIVYPPAIVGVAVLALLLGVIRAVP
jgi:hypothetical protein